MLYFLCNSLGGDFWVLGCRLLSEEKDMLPNDQGMIEEQRPVESDKDFGDMGRGWFWIQERPDIFFDVLNFDRKPLDFSAIVCWKTHPIQYFTVSFASIYSIWLTSWSMCEEHQQFVLPFHGSNLPKYGSRAEFVLHHLRYRACRGFFFRRFVSFRFEWQELSASKEKGSDCFPRQKTMVLGKELVLKLLRAWVQKYYTPENLIP